MKARVFYTLEAARNVIFDRLGMDPKTSVSEAWKILICALQDGTVIAEGRVAEYSEVGFEIHITRMLPVARLKRRHRMQPVSRDWWIDARPAGHGELISLQRDTADGFEILEYIQVKASDIDDKWPAPQHDSHVVVFYACIETPKVKSDMIVIDGKAEAVARLLKKLFPSNCSPPHAVDIAVVGLITSAIA